MKIYLDKFVFLIIPLTLALIVQLDVPITDGFHEGEYLNNTLVMANYYATGLNFPLLIHGAMDYIPSLISSAIFGDNRLIVGTRFINILAVAICWILWLDLSRMLLREHKEKQIWQIIFIILFFWMAMAAGDNPVKKQQAFVGTRDLFLVLSIWSAVRASVVEKSYFSNFFFLASGVFAALSFYWSYDRGIMSAIWAGALVFAFTVNGQQKTALALAVGYSLSIVGFSQWGIFGSFIENYTNVVYWIVNSSEVWHIPLKSKLPALPGALAMAGLAFLIISHSIFKMAKMQWIKMNPFVAGLIFIQFVLLIKLYRLPGFPASYYFIWPAFLILMIDTPNSVAMRIANNAVIQFADNFKNSWHEIKKQKLFFVGLLTVAAIIFSNTVVSSLFVFKQLANPVADDKLLNQRHYGLDDFTQRNFPCVFQWSNEGVFSVLLKKPYCTQYGYAVYISKNNEASVLAELKANPPGFIVYDSPFWSMKIYGRHMRDRLPDIDLFIRENYVFHDNGSGYVFATPKFNLEAPK